MQSVTCIEQAKAQTEGPALPGEDACVKTAVQKLQNSKMAAWLLTVWAVGLYPLLCQFFAEWVRLQKAGAALRYFVVRLPAAALGTVFLAGVVLTLAFLTRRPWVGALLVGGLAFIGAYANFYKITYRGDPVLPKDLVIAGDAAKVATELSIPPTFPMGVFFLFFSLSVLILLPVRLPGKGRLVVRLPLAAAGVALCALWLTGVLWNTGVQEKLDIDTMAFRPGESYEKATFATGFLMYAGALNPKQPQGYSAQTVQQAAEALPQESHTDQRKPDVVVVMLESYYRLSNVQGASYDTALTQNYDRYAAEGISGCYYSDKYSGGTEEMEFGALTGFSTSLLPTGSIPYVEYVNGQFPSYPRFLKEHGYKTIALHPYDPTIYSRNTAYPAMGFDEFYSQDDFVSPQKHGTYIDDVQTAEKLIELYEQATADGSPVFLHTVTMQNHIPNAPDEYADDYKVHASLDGVDSYYVDSLDSVATGLRDADRAIGLLCDYFSKSDRDVVLLIFGDHQTAIGDKDGAELLDELPSFNAQSSYDQMVNTHQVPYLMWANFETKQAETAGAMPPYQLLATTLQQYNVLRPAWFDFLAQSQTTLKGINLGYVIEPDGSLGSTVRGASDAQTQLLHTQSLLQYDAMFGKGYALAQMYR